ncbi:MAG: sulfatase-like hydrolase/transferase, partial [Planctomycetes bacterium]|nr:sulfatase-like hydrolase/transferase [Planctomycetota bacterium]
LDDTVIVFTSDHGEFLGDYNCFGKRAMLDAASRIPMLVRWPGRRRGGRVCDTPVSLVDVMPTLLGAAGIGAEGLDLDGEDLGAIADGAGADRTVYSQHSRGADGLHMAVNRRWKYIWSAADRREFLFDRAGDPDETRSRGQLPLCRDVVRAMRANLMDRYRTRGHTEDLDGERWRLYDQPAVPADPDAWLLRQDHPWAEAKRAIPGYTDEA